MLLSGSIDCTLWREDSSNMKVNEVSFKIEEASQWINELLFHLWLFLWWRANYELFPYFLTEQTFSRVPRLSF